MFSSGYCEKNVNQINIHQSNLFSINRRKIPKKYNHLIATNSNYSRLTHNLCDNFSFHWLFWTKVTCINIVFATICWNLVHFFTQSKFWKIYETSNRKLILLSIFCITFSQVLGPANFRLLAFHIVRGDQLIVQGDLQRTIFSAIKILKVWSIFFLITFNILF